MSDKHQTLLGVLTAAEALITSVNDCASDDFKDSEVGFHLRALSYGMALTMKSYQERLKTYKSECSRVCY